MLQVNAHSPSVHDILKYKEANFVHNQIPWLRKRVLEDLGKFLDVKSTRYITLELLATVFCLRSFWNNILV